MSMNDFAWITLFIVCLMPAFWFIGILLECTRIPCEKNYEWPLVSVIVAARNEEKTIERCLRSLLALDYPASLLEIILVDDHSTDETLSIAETISQEHSCKLKILQAPDIVENTAPKKNALEYGICQSSGEFLFFTDADNEAPREWIVSMLKFYDEKTDAVAGLSLPQKANSLFYYLERIVVNYASVSAIGWNSPGSVCGQNFSYRRKAYEDAGGMNFKNIPSGDDDLMAQAIARKNRKVRFCLSPQSMVQDLRNPRFPDFTQSTTRHLSAAKSYPLHWRVIYGLTIISSVLFLALFFFAFLKMYPIILLSALFLKSTFDGFGIFMLKKKSKFKFSIPDFILLELFLPLYACLRPLLLLLPNYSWKKRVFSNTFTPDKNISVR